MGKPSWNGILSLGLVTVPVELYRAVREQDVSFKQLCPSHEAPIRMNRFCSAGGEALASADLVSGFPMGGGKFIVLNEDDFNNAAAPLGKTFDIQVFLPEADVDIRFFHTTYFVVPKAEGQASYALLREAVRRNGKIGIGMIALRTKQQMAALRVLGPALVLQLMHWSDELVETCDFEFPDISPRAQEIEMAAQLVASFPTELSAGTFVDAYRKNLERIIEAKGRGETVTFADAPEPESAEVIDLVALLQKSIDAREAA
jgi:DNA end-binding protein Ku